MRTFSISVDIAAPPARVFDVMTDVERWHEWTPSVRHIRRLDKRPFAVGSRLFIRQPKLPPAMWKVTAIEPERSFESISGSPGLRVLARHGVAQTPSGSRATLSIELSGLFGGLFGRMTKDLTERYLALEAQGLKARSEDPSFRHQGALKR